MIKVKLSRQVRQGLKSFSNWPTYPQLYLEGLQPNYLFVVFHNFLQTLHTVVTALSPIPISPRWVDWRSRHHQRDGGVWRAADHASQEGISCTLKVNASQMFYLCTSHRNIIHICQGVAWVSPEKPHPPSSCHGVYEGQWYDHLKGYMVISQSNRFIFKGDPSQPKCGFSKQLMPILQETKVLLIPSSLSPRSLK